MLNRINQYLLTHYPLIWNIRLPWVLAVTAILHLLFLFGGYGSVNYHTLQNYYSVSSINDGTVFVFSLLCSMLVIVGWLIFYLRNNAFKSFYRLKRGHLALEFLLILIILFATISFPLTYEQGARIRIKQLVPRQTLIQEANQVNRAAAFMPVERNDYFLLNSCEELARRKEGFINAPSREDTARYSSTNDPLLRQRAIDAIFSPAAFSYRYYCTSQITLSDYPGYLTAEDHSAVVNQWLSAGRRDSVEASLKTIIAIAGKYRIDHNLQTDTLIGWVFKDSLFPVSNYISTHRSYDDETVYRPFFELYDLKRVLSLADECYETSIISKKSLQRLLAYFYFALGSALLLASYRLFSRRVFLISIIGTIAWCIFIGLVAASSQSENMLYSFLVLLFVIISALALTGTLGRSNIKTTTGVTLTWHIYALPFLVPIIMMWISYYYSRGLIYIPDTDSAVLAAMNRQKSPVGYWVSHHTSLIMWLNLLFVLLYFITCFTRLARRWHSQPEE